MNSIYESAYVHIIDAILRLMISTNNSLDRQKSHDGSRLSRLICNRYRILYVYINWQQLTDPSSYTFASMFFINPRENNAKMKCLSRMNIVIQHVVRYNNLKYGCLGSTAGRSRGVATRIVVIVVVIIVTRLTGVTRTIELFVRYKCAQVIETYVAWPTVTRSSLVRIETFLRRWTLFAFLLHLARHSRGWWQNWWLRTFTYFTLPVNLYLRWYFFRCSGRSRFRSRKNCFVVEDTRYVIFLLREESNFVVYLILFFYFFFCSFPFQRDVDWIFQFLIWTTIPEDPCHVFQSAFLYAFACHVTYSLCNGKSYI